MNKLKDIDIAILCGGLGTRLRTVIGESQKVMAQVNNEPFLNVLLRDLKSQGARKVILCTGYQSQAVEEYYRKNSLGLEIEFSPETEPLGTGGALKNARNRIKSNPFVVMNGDSYCPIDFKKLLQFAVTCKALMTIAVYKTAAEKDFGVLTMDQDKAITQFKEKTEAAGAGYLNAGVYLCDQTVFSLMPKGKKFSLENELFPMLIGKSFYGFEVNNPFVDIGQPERFEQAQRILKGK